MAVISVKEQWPGTGSTENTTSGTSTRVFNVLCDGYDAPFEHWYARNHPEIPAINDVHPLDPYLFARNKSVSANPGPLLYIVTVNYGSIGNPTLLDPDIEWSFASSNVQIDRDINGDAITNSAGETSDPPLTDDTHDLVYRITYNSFGFDPLIAAEYMGAVNQDIWFGFEPKHAKVINFSGRLAGSEDTVTYWEISQEVQIRFEDTWDKRYLDQGFRKKTGVDADGKPEYENIVDKNGDPVSQPVLLDGAGGILADDADPVFLTVQTRPEKIFAGVIAEIA